MNCSGDSAHKSVSVTFNERQLQAIEHVRGPMLVVAGAGTGKTSVLVERIARLLRQGHARADEVLALTFTDNAADEMAGRVRTAVAGIECDGLRAMTFHAYCSELLQRSGAAFRLLLPEDLWVFLRRRISDLGLKWYIRAASPGQFLDALLDFFDRCHDEVVSPADYRKYVDGLSKPDAVPPRVVSAKLAEGMTREEVVARCREIAGVFEKVEQMLAREGLGSFAHMITRALELLRRDEQLRAKEQSRARFLLLDEFQDVNLAQIELAELLAGNEQNVFAVGDPDQAIYRFRGASAAAFEEFARRFPKTERVTLTENQRSHTPILKCAYAVVRSNPSIKPAGFERKPLASARDLRDQMQSELLPRFPVEIVANDGDEQEAGDVARRIEALRQARSKRRDAKRRSPHIAVLYRQHSHRDLLVRELVARDIPFTVVGLNALDTPEVRDLLAALRVLESTADGGSLFRVAALPRFKLDPEALRLALKNAPHDSSFLHVFEKVSGADMVLKAVREIAEEVRAKGSPAVAALELVRKRFGFAREAPPTQAFTSFVQKWRERAIAGDGSLRAFLEYMEYFPEARGGAVIEMPACDETDLDTVRLMTAHAAKGLEFEHVFILRANQGSFPTVFRERLFEFPQQLRRELVAEGDDKEIYKEEERRLFYVGMTRARETLTLCAHPRNREQRPSGFVRDLMADPEARRYWSRVRAAPFTVDLAAQAIAPGPGVASWLLNSPRAYAYDGPLSTSLVENYETCPLQFKIGRCWEIPGEVAAQMQYGNVIHTLLRDYYESLRAGRPKSADEMVGLLREALASSGMVDPVQRALYEKEGTVQLREFVRLQQEGQPTEVIGTERAFEITLGGVRVKGRLDRIDRITGNRVAIIDYKTGKPRTDDHARKSLQLSIYALAAREKWGFEAERLAFYNIADNSEVSCRRDQKHLDDACERVAHVAEEIKRGNFDPTPGFHCNWCAYRNLCPATEERLYQIQTQAAGVS